MYFFWQFYLVDFSEHYNMLRRFGNTEDLIRFDNTSHLGIRVACY